MSFSKSKKGLLLFTFLLVMTLPLAFGQGINTGGIVGTIADQNQAVISGATIKAVQQETNSEFNATSNETGGFSLLGLPVGPYTVSINAPNFSSIKIAGVQVLSGVNTGLGTQVLKVGATGETVEVEGTAPIVEANSSQITTSFGNRQAAELPVGNGFDALALLIPGVVSTGDAGFSNNNGAGLSVNGQRGRSNNFQIDGQSNNDNSVAGPQLFVGNQDIISEVQIITNNFSAEYGRNLGSVVNYITKAGTNAFHGTGFEYYTGSFADSLTNDLKSPFFGFCPKGVAAGSPTIFAPGTGVDGCRTVKVPHFTENRYGGTLGGPIVKDKLWFFGSGMRDYAGQTNTATSSSIAPTPAGLLLLENTYCGTAFATYTPDPCPSHPALGAYLVNGPYANKYGNPSPAGGAKTVSVNDGKTTINLPLAGITRSVPASFVDNEASGRIDWQASSKDRIFGRYLFQRQLNADAAGTTSAGTFVDVPDEGQQLGIDWVRNWTSTFLNQARFSYSKTTLSFEGQKGGTKQFAGCTVANINSCPTRIDFSGGNLGSAGFATNLPQARLVKVTSYQDNAQWVRGRHTIKFGGEFDHQFSPNDFLPSINGRFRFSSFTTLLKNTPNNATIGDGVVRLNFKENDLAFYGQDDWKVLDNLTLNLGLRWEWNQQAINLLHDLTVKRETGPNPFWDPTLPLAARTVPKVPEALKNFGPNIGFAFTPRGFGPVFGEGKTVIRGGFRIAYDPSFYNIFLNVATAAPTVNLASLATPSRPVPAGVLYNGTEIRAAKLPLIPRGGNPGFRNQTQVTKNFHNPYSEQYSLGLQREITPKIAAEVRYVGNHTVGNFQTINANPALISAFTGENQAALFPGSVPAGVVPCTTAGTPGAGEGRIDCSHALVRLRANSAYSFYNGLQTELRVRAYHGLSGSLGYTFSRTIDNVSEIFSTFGGGNSIAGSQNFFDNKLAERNVNGTSYPNVLTVSYIYDFPFYKSQQGFVGKVLGGWETSGIYSYHTGQPYTAVEAGGLATYCDDNFNFSFFGASTCRPAVGNPNAPLDTVGQCTTTAPGCNPVDFFGGTATQFHYIYNDTLYAKSVKNPFGGAGRNTLRGQTFNNLDVALYKNVKATERLTMQLGVTAGNVLNRQYRGVPDPVIEDGRFDISGTAASNPAFNPGGTYQNTFGNSSGRRRLNFGVRLIF